MSAGHRDDNVLDRLIAVLERSFERSGVFFIGRLLEGHQHSKFEQLLTHHLERKHISTVCFRFDQSPVPSLKDFLHLLDQLKDDGQRQVLVVWCLEHLDESILVDRLRDLNVNRRRLCQTLRRGQVSIPIVLLVNETHYREYLARQARDLLDCLKSPFDISTANIEETFNSDAS